MQNVYVKCSYDVISMPQFFDKLKAFIGDFRIEQQSIKESYDGVVTISFYTDKVEIKEGEERQVDITAKNNPDGTWEFTEITK